MIQCEVEIIKELPKDKIKQWEDKVVYMRDSKGEILKVSLDKSETKPTKNQRIVIGEIYV